MGSGLALGFNTLHWTMPSIEQNRTILLYLKLVGQLQESNLMQPFFERLNKYYDNIGEILRGQKEAASVFPNTTDIGNSRERVYAEMLKQHVPSSCNILFGGFLFDQAGKESKQIDIIITNDSSIQYNFPGDGDNGKSFACIDGTIAIVSVKSTLDKKELASSLNNIASIPDQQPLTKDRYSIGWKIKGFDDWPCKIVYASDGIERDTLMTNLNTFYEENASILHNKRPNMIHVLGKYLVVRADEQGSETRGGKPIPPNTFHSFDIKSDAVALSWAITKIQEIAQASKMIAYRYHSIVDKLM
jgi:hypothetical protein